MNNLTSKLAVIGLLALTTTGCSMFGSKADSVDVQQRKSINSQEFSTFFEDDGIKVNWECIDRDWFPSLGLRCDERTLKSIEIIVTVPTGGGTNMNASNAQVVGEEMVKARLAMFIEGTTETQTITNIFGTSNEVQDDTYRNPIAGTGQNAGTRPDIPAVIGMQSRDATAPRDPNPNMNFAVTSNSNTSKRDIQVMIKSQAQLIIRGLGYKYDKADDQLLQVTGVWNKDVSEKIQNEISNYFN